MKKIILKKTKFDDNLRQTSYKINYQQELNLSQYEVVMHSEGPALVVAGAGTGKTRTLIYRVARLIEDGIPPVNILLLTFTRKAAQEMLSRASLLLDGRAENVSGGTFHSFASLILRQYAQAIAYASNFTILDQGDAEDVINLLRHDFVNKYDKRRFPTKATINKIWSLAVNTQSQINEIWQKRWKDLETLIIIAERYRSLGNFLNELSLDPPNESVSELTPESKEEEFLTLSTIHSAKGLEWKVVFLIWALVGKFPSAKASDSIDRMEEERRLFYVACTRAKDQLYVTYPTNIFDRESGFVLSEPSRFLSEITDGIAERYVLTEEDDE